MYVTGKKSLDLSMTSESNNQFYEKDYAVCVLVDGITQDLTQLFGRATSVENTIKIHDLCLNALNHPRSSENLIQLAQNIIHLYLPAEQKRSEKKIKKFISRLFNRVGQDISTIDWKKINIKNDHSFFYKFFHFVKQSVENRPLNTTIKQASYSHINKKHFSVN